jgi:hypothetical protein
LKYFLLDKIRLRNSIFKSTSNELNVYVVCEAEYKVIDFKEMSGLYRTLSTSLPCLPWVYVFIAFSQQRFLSEKSEEHWGWGGG